MGTPDVALRGCRISLSGTQSAGGSPRLLVSGSGSRYASNEMLSTPMSRSNPGMKSRSSLLDLNELEVSNVVTMVCFATALMENLARINRGK